MSILVNETQELSNEIQEWHMEGPPVPIQPVVQMDEGVNESHNTDDEIHNETEPECPTLQRPDKDMDNRCCSGKLWCNRDVCGMISAATTWLLMFYAEFVVMMVILMPGVSIYPIYSYTNMTIFQTLTFLGMSSHLRTMFTNPGAIPKGNATTEMIQLMNYSDRQIIFKCTKCCSIKPDRAHHCSICQRCIRKMDHHCLWVNNCIGDNNQKYFMLFNFYIGIISTHAFSLALYHLVTCILSEWRYCTPYSPVVTVVLLLLLMAAALFFAIFTAIMFGTQLHAIWNNITGIEKLMNEQPWPVHMSRWKSTQSVFGRSSIFWFSPFTKPTINAEVESFVEFEP